MNSVFDLKFRIASYEVDPNGYVRPSAIMAYLQEAAELQSVQWKLSVRDMFKVDKTWVMTRYKLSFIQRPHIGEEVQVTTWLSRVEERYCVRDFEVKTLSGETVALATASYALIGLRDRRPVDILSVLQTEKVQAHRALLYDFPTLPQVKQEDRVVMIPVMLRDLDLNGHVNHIIYAQWGLEAVPLTVWKSYRPLSLEISYRAETHYGSQVRVVVEIQEPVSAGFGPEILHQVFHLETGVELARLRSSWGPVS